MNWIAVCASNLKLRLALIVLPVVLGVATTLQASLNPGQRHMDTQSCSSCHLSGADTNKEDAHLLVAPQEKLCADSCHKNSIRISHPSGIRPTFPVPAAYPLDWKGDMTCSTCHNVHGNNKGLLRGNMRGRNLCLSCHNSAFFDKMADQGVSMLSGHLSSAIAKIDLNSLDVDPFTIQCMGCHANYADTLGTTIDSRQILRHAADKSVSHPIGRRYSESLMNGRYKPESFVNQKLMLPDGRLSCVTCHRGYSKEHGQLRMSTKGSALCFECHDL